MAKPDIEVEHPNYQAAGKLGGKVAIVTGGDSGIGAATAILFAREGADVTIVYLSEDKDARRTANVIETYGQRALPIKADLSVKVNAEKLVDATIRQLGHLDILVNNAGTQETDTTLEGISEAQLKKTFATNIFSMFYLTQAALPKLRKSASIINTASVTAYRGSPHLMDYASTKGAIVSFTRSLAVNLAPKGIRVNAVAPGPIWTDLIFDSFSPKDIAKFGQDQPLGRAGQPYEVAPAFVYLASDDASYTSGEVIHVNGGEIVNS
jgi:NAD(P)-dependent dehydrogenase (short-subunit alcohol dehydrogenase family)